MSLLFKLSIMDTMLKTSFLFSSLLIYTKEYMFFLIYILLLCFSPSRSVTIKGISIYGLETPLKNFVCSWVHPVEYYIVDLKALGFNAIRMPFSYEYIKANDLSKLDHFMEHSFIHNMSVVLDLHRIWSYHQGPTPEENGVSISDVVDMWKSVLSRYEHFENLKGHNAFNEYQGVDIEYLTSYHKTIFDAIENQFPDRFYHFATGYLWSGNLHGFTLEDLPYNNKIIYSVHKYVFSGTSDEKDWEKSFGNEFPPEKICIGEWGWKQQNPNEVEWAVRFIAYLRKKNITMTAFWTIAHSGDTDGIYFDDCENLDGQKLHLLQSLWADETRFLRGRT